MKILCVATTSHVNKRQGSFPYYRFFVVNNHHHHHHHVPTWIQDQGLSLRGRYPPRRPHQENSLLYVIFKIIVVYDHPSYRRLSSWDTERLYVSIEPQSDKSQEIFGRVIITIILSIVLSIIDGECWWEGLMSDPGKAAAAAVVTTKVTHGWVIHSLHFHHHHRPPLQQQQQQEQQPVQVLH